MSNCQQCGKPNPPSKSNRRRKFCSKKCGKLNHYNRYQAEGRYYTKKHPNWGELRKEEKEDREKRRKEYEWCQQNMYDTRRIEEEYGIRKQSAWSRAKAHGLEPRIVRWKQEYHFYTKEQAEKIANEDPPPGSQVRTTEEQRAKYRERNKRTEVRKRNWKRLRERMKNNPALRLRRNVSALVYDALVIKQGKTKGGSTFEHLPYTPLQLKEHIENQFDTHMSWDNYGSYWQLDHIVPQAALIYDSLTHPNFAKCWDLSNLQPLEKSKNASKGSWHEGKIHRYKKK